MIDFDAHHGETDAAAAAEFVRRRFFLGAYDEPSSRGHHLHPVLRVGRIRRRDFNQMLDTLASDLALLLAQEGFTCTVEVKGKFTTINSTLEEIEKRGTLAAVPHLRAGDKDLQRLLAAPIFLPSAIQGVADAAEWLRVPHRVLLKEDLLPDVCVPRIEVRHSDDAWIRMMQACFDFTVIHHHLPDVEELLNFYQELHGGVASSERRRRARQAIQYRAKTFDQNKAANQGYERQRERLLEAVRRHCMDRSNKCDTSIVDEDLAIGLYTVMLNSFTVHPVPYLQFTCPNNCISGMFRALRVAGVTLRGAQKPSKVVAIKTILERAELIKCIDQTWVNIGWRRRGKKYTIGPAHWRYQEWQRFCGLHFGKLDMAASRLAA